MDKPILEIIEQISDKLEAWILLMEAAALKAATKKAPNEGSK
jgi:hypothetical protein